MSTETHSRSIQTGIQHISGLNKLCQAHPRSIQAIRITSLVHKSITKHTPYQVKPCPVYIKSTEVHHRSMQTVFQHIPSLYKWCRAHFRYIQAVLSTSLVYTRCTAHISGQLKPCLLHIKSTDAHSRSIQTMLQHISNLYKSCRAHFKSIKPYTSRTKHIPGVYKPYWAHSRSIQAVLITH